MILVPMERLKEGIQGIKAGVCIFPRSSEELAFSAYVDLLGSSYVIDQGLSWGAIPGDLRKRKRHFFLSKVGKILSSKKIQKMGSRYREATNVGKMRRHSAGGRGAHVPG